MCLQRALMDKGEEPGASEQSRTSNAEYLGKARMYKSLVFSQIT
jgi:hypothetical protein